MNPIVLKNQLQLQKMGYQPGEIDGIRGRNTIAAIKQFQRANAFPVTGLVDDRTYRRLHKLPKSDVLSSPTDATPWMDQVAQVMGWHEIRNKAKLWAWLMSDGIGVGDPSKTPYCGDGVQTAIALTLPEEVIPTKPFLAAAWSSFGISCDPQFGAILSFWRGSPDSWKGHVGFYIGETKTHFLVRGFNQSNMVRDSFIEKKRLRKNGCRWPETALAPMGGAVLVSASGAPISTNEA